MSAKPIVKHDEKSPEIDFKKIQDIIYWSKKWEISPHQLIEASQTCEVSKSASSIPLQNEELIQAVSHLMQK